MVLLDLEGGGRAFCFAFHKLGLPVTVIRYFNDYGPRLDRLDVVRLFTIFMGAVAARRGPDDRGRRQANPMLHVRDRRDRGDCRRGLKPEANGQAINIGTDVETSVIDSSPR